MNKDLLAPNLVKFLVTSAACLFIGTVQGAVQVMEPIRSWLVSIGAPNSNPGHLIDPLAHAHINLIGGVVLFIVAMIYYHLPKMSGKKIYSEKLIDHTYYWITVGIVSFYTTLISFGIIEGNLLLQNPEEQARVHAYYGPVVSVCATIMTIGYGCFFVNIAMSVVKKSIIAADSFRG